MVEQKEVATSVKAEEVRWGIWWVVVLLEWARGRWLMPEEVVRWEWALESRSDRKELRWKTLDEGRRREK